MEIGAYCVRFSPQAVEDIAYFKKLGDTSIQKKITKLVAELEQHPTTGTGRVEALRFDMSGMWSRRINSEHRIVYRIDEEKHEVYVLALKGHY